MKILVTPRSVTRDGHPSLDRLRAAGCDVLFCRPGMQPDEAELCALLPGCAGYLAGVEPVTARVLAAATELRVICRNGAGVDNIDLAAAAARGIAVHRAAGANARGVVELTLTFLLLLSRGILPAATALRGGAWERGAAGGELAGRTLGIIGCGQVGRLVAALAVSCGMTVLACDAAPDPDFQPGPAFHYAPLPEVLMAADFVSLHCPPRDDGQPVLDAVGIALMKPGAFLLNTARYDSFDAAAVLAALEQGRLAGLALDVFDCEPPADRRLVEHPRVIATPHLGAFTRESIDRAMHSAVDQLLHALRPGA